MESSRGRVALVTGGSRGIGAAIARRLAREGIAVALTYNASEQRAKEVVRDIANAGGRAIPLRANMADTDEVTSAVERAVAEFGGLDILVNNAGIFPFGEIDTLTLADYEETMAIHSRAAFVATQAAIRHMGSGGRIISIGSNLVERAPTPGLSLYSMSKAALVGFTKGLARDLGPRGITATVVHPGSTDTEMNPADGPDAEAEREHIPVGRYGTAEEVAAMVAHLAGPEGGNISGTAITVDGGSSA